jgi:uncharacterized protein (DUF433 family)
MQYVRKDAIKKARNQLGRLLWDKTIDDDVLGVKAIDAGLRLVTQLLVIGLRNQGKIPDVVADYGIEVDDIAKAMTSTRLPSMRLACRLYDTYACNMDIIRQVIPVRNKRQREIDYA